MRDAPVALDDFQLHTKVTTMPLFDYCQRLNPPFEDDAPSAADSHAADPAVERRMRLSGVLRCAGAQIEQDATCAALLHDVPEVA